MRLEVMVAVISGMVAIAGAITAWVQATRVARIQADSELAIETLKNQAQIQLETIRQESMTSIELVKRQADQNLERIRRVHEHKRIAFERACVEAEPIEQMLADAWTLIQEIRYSLTRVISVSHGTPIWQAPGIDGEIEELSERIGALFSIAARAGMHIDRNVDCALMEAVNLVKPLRNGYLDAFHRYQQLDSKRRGEYMSEYERSIRHDLIQVQRSLDNPQSQIATVRRSVRKNLAAQLSEILKDE